MEGTIKYYILASALFLESCWFQPGTFKDTKNFLLTDSLVIKNTKRREKIKSVTICLDTLLPNAKNALIDTIFSGLGIDEYKIPISRERIDTSQVYIFIKLTTRPGLSIDLKPGELSKRKKILFEGDLY